MTRVKICGITNLEDALTAVESGADALGFVFVPDTPRFVKPDQVAAVVAELPPFITTVGLFASKDAAKIRTIANQCRLDAIQLHADVTPEFCSNLDRRVIKAIRVKDESSLSILSDYDVNAFLLDAYVEGKMGGTGKVFDWNLALQAKDYGRIIVAGGLNPDNVAQAVRRVKPYGVDVSSGVELVPGRKDPDKVGKFINAVRTIGI
ncbi:MAG: phosphoribosylanthranilate isomerase [Candidatus Poribacteria bacterium]|nr:phosphoribosylanthranilate isomerase [Candidatus Poribacteria bacterium]